MKVLIIIWVFNAFAVHDGIDRTIDVHVNLLQTEAACLTEKANWDTFYRSRQQQFQSWCNRTEYPTKPVLHHESDVIGDLLRGEQR